MKLHYIKLSLFIISSLLVSCTDMLDLQKDGRITFDEIFKDRDQTRAYLNSCFVNLSSITPNLDMTSYCDESQNAEVTKSGSPYSDWYKGQATAEWFPVPESDIWASMFEGIRKCNVFLANIDEADIVATADEIAGWKSQAYTLRGLYYLQLIKRFGGVPLVLKPLAVGADLSNFKRATFNECVTSILNDCDSALMSSSTAFPLYNGSKTNGMMTRAVCYAIKSESILYAASPLWNDGTYTWTDAMNITKQAIDSLNPSTTRTYYALYSKKPAVDVAQNTYELFHLTTSDVARQDKETILQLGAKLQVWKYAGMPDTPDMISAGPNPTQDLVDAYEMVGNGEAPITGYNDADRLNPVINNASGYDPQNPYVGRDPRFYATIYFNGAKQNLSGTEKYVQTYVGGAAGIDQTDFTHTCTGYYLRKFNRWNSSKNNEADGYIRLFRYAEVLMNFAEAAANAVGPDVKVGNLSARDAVNLVRARAGMPDFPSQMQKDAFLKKYINERRVEFAFEGQRYFDVRRWKLLKDTESFVTGMHIVKNEDGTFTYNRFKFNDRKTTDDKYYLFPINRDEVNKCLSVTGLNWQNPGW